MLYNLFFIYLCGSGMSCKIFTLFPPLCFLTVVFWHLIITPWMVFCFQIYKINDVSLYFEYKTDKNRGHFDAKNVVPEKDQFFLMWPLFITPCCKDFWLKQFNFYICLKYSFTKNRKLTTEYIIISFLSCLLINCLVHTRNMHPWYPI